MSDTEHISKDASYDGMLIYTDGSADQHRGIIGWGVHGYVYNNDAPKKGAGHPKVVPTNMGYLLKADSKDKMITPIGYFNIIGATTEKGSNNTAEVAAFRDALKFAKDYRVKKITVRPDSEYVIKGFTEWLPGWAKRGFKKATGEDVPNHHVWREVFSLYNDILINGAKVDFKWVKGHSGEFGNSMVDKFASIGRSKSTTGENGVYTTVYKPEGFFKPSQERHPLICMRSILFTTDKELNYANGYIMTNLTKVEEMVGRNDTDAAVAYCELKQTDPLIDVVKNRQIELANEVASLVLLRYDRLFIEARSEDIAKHNEHILKRPFSHRVDLYFATDQSFREKDPSKRTPITEDLVPVMLADRVWKAGVELEAIVSVMKGVRERPDLPIVGAEVVDISQFLFKTIKDKKGAEALDLDPKITPTTREIIFTHTSRGRKTDYHMVMGLHLPGRNTLKKMTEAKELRAWLVLRHISNDAEKYMTVFYVDGEWLAYTGYSSNLVIHSS